MLTPYKRAHGLGSAKGGAGHWWWQRATALALVPLSAWLLFALVRYTAADYATVVAWLAQPLNATLLVCGVVLAAFHAALGVQVILEDYVCHVGIRMVMVLAVQLLLLGVGVFCVVAILRVALMAGT